MDGEDITSLKPLQKLQQGMAYVPQGRNIFPQLTVEHNLEFGGVSLRDLKETRRRMERVYEQFPILHERRKKQAGILSGGEQKMLEIGRAMLLEPKFLLIDEPSIGLSPILVQQTFDLLLALRDKGVHVVNLTAPFEADLTMQLSDVRLRDPELFDTSVDGTVAIRGRPIWNCAVQHRRSGQRPRGGSFRSDRPGRSCASGQRQRQQRQQDQTHQRWYLMNGVNVAMRS